MRHASRSRNCAALLTIAAFTAASATIIFAQAPGPGGRGAATAAQPAPQAPGTPAVAKPAGGSPDLQRGKAVFDEWCAGCHAPGPRHPGTQALDALYKGTKPGALEQRTDLVPKLTEQFVRTGVSVMAPFRKTEISDRDLAALAAYLAPKSR
jgi:mono/diheme cytochrome c family protein